MKIFTAAQIREWDAYTIHQAGITSLLLMERAAQQCTDFILQKCNQQQQIKIFCGTGNNGGDGLAIARLLINKGMQVQAYVVEKDKKGTEDFEHNLQQLQMLSAVIFIHAANDFPYLSGDEIIVDALFGSGLTKALAGLFEALVNHINTCSTCTISVDMPSGMFTDSSSKGSTVIKAKHTLTFQTMKRCFFVAENAEYFGTIHLLNIGLSDDFIEITATIYETSEEKKIAELYIPRKEFSHKGTFGHALLVAGNHGKMGAAALCARACLHTGIGLLTCSVPDKEFAVLQTSVHEAMLIAREDAPDFSKYNAVGIGPGIGTGDDSKEYLRTILQQFKKPMVIDADALNIISANTGWLSLLPAQSILTPHPKEFDRLFGEHNNDFERIEKAIAVSNQYPIIIVLKGHKTLIAENGKGWFNTTGNPGMATGGTGDMLTGMIASLLAQQYQPVVAALAGVYLHGLSADIALQNQSYESLLPSAMIEHIGDAFKTIQIKKGI